LQNVNDIVPKIQIMQGAMSDNPLEIETGPERNQGPGG
jgi:hypothetical protein